MSLTHRVARGAAYLDANDRMWFIRASSLTLDMSDAKRCVLAQLIKSYTGSEGGYRAWLAQNEKSETWAIRHGFNTLRTNLFGWKNKKHTLLWKHEIRERIWAESASISKQFNYNRPLLDAIREQKRMSAV